MAGAICHMNIKCVEKAVAAVKTHKDQRSATLVCQYHLDECVQNGVEIIEKREIK